MALKSNLAFWSSKHILQYIFSKSDVSFAYQKDYTDEKFSGPIH